MASPLLSISVDSSGLVDMLKRVGPLVDMAVRPVARETAGRIVNEMRARLDRQTHGTGETASGIHFELMRNGNGYVVLMGDAVPQSVKDHRKKVGMSTRSQNQSLYQMKHTGIWLEFGTKFHYPNPFWFASAELEEGPHLQRLTEAVQRALDELGA